MTQEVHFYADIKALPGRKSMFDEATHALGSFRHNAMAKRR